MGETWIPSQFFSSLHGLTVGWAKTAFGILTAWIPSLTAQTTPSRPSTSRAWHAWSFGCQALVTVTVTREAEWSKVGEKWIRGAEHGKHQRGCCWSCSCLRLHLHSYTPCRVRLTFLRRLICPVAPPNATLRPDVPRESRRRDRHGCTILTTTAQPPSGPGRQTATWPAWRWAPVRLAIGPPSAKLCYIIRW